MTIPLAITGAAGRMGKRLISLILEESPRRFELVAALDAPNTPAIGQDAGTVAGSAPCGVKISPALEAAPKVLIDFSAPVATRALLPICAAKKIAMIIGTTGLTAADQNLIDDAAKTIPIIQAGNTGLGINVLLAIVAQAAQKLGPDFDIEIVESHHNQKKDAPSGTAMALADSILAATGKTQEDLDFGRHGHEAKRIPGSIGMHAVRMGDVVGEHTVYYSTQGERIEIKHVATNRDTFARGALRAAAWIATKAPGRYQMKDVLGL
jgi:4-hydroxy-tetrahydrodipicolinate reductase